MRHITQHDISVVVPVMGEEDNVLPLVSRIRKALAGRKIEVIFVDDSPDKQTVEAVARARRLHRTRNFSIQLYHRTGAKRWGGLSGAVADGIKRVGSSKIVVMDGDLQHPPETIPDMIEASMSSDIVVASRYCRGGSASGLAGGLRRFVSNGSTLLAKIFFPLRLRRVSDPMTGFFLIHRSQIDRGKLRPKGFKILLEILATHPELSVTEVPLQFAERQAGESHGSIKQGLAFLSQLVTLRVSQFARMFCGLPKFVQFGAVGGSVFGLGMVLLFVLVEGFGWPPLAASAVQLAVTFWANYILNRTITWRERTVSRLAIHKFMVSRTATTALNYLLFAWLISLHFSFTLFGYAADFTVNYLAASVITLLAVTIINYEVSDRWAFAGTTPSKKQLPVLSRDGFQAWKLALVKYVPKRGKITARLPRFTIPEWAYYAAIAALIITGSGVFFGAVATFAAALAIAGLALFVQASIEVWRMIYTYREPESVDRLRFPAPGRKKPRERFCIIVPARHESAVIAATLRHLAKQTHPNVDIVAVMCDDDYDTLQAAYSVEAEEPRISVMQYPLRAGEKPSKPKQLNHVFRQIDGLGYSVIGVIDAEDTVHPELLTHIDVAFRDRKTDIVQGGVQLMNHDSSWYSLHNVLEYYRWFNSAMAFQADSNFMPLGGNTIFIREKLLRKAGGWPETLTEDCSLGVLLSAKYQAKTAVYYEPRLATQEETPDTLKGLFKQRVRWNQGFFHEWRKGVWRDLPQLRQRMLASYVLLSPLLLAGIGLCIPVSLTSLFFLDAPVALAMVMYLPFVPLSLLLVLNMVFLHDFGKAFQRNVSLRHYGILVATHLAYQVVLNAAAFWSVVRELRGEQSWYKTVHSGQHRAEPAYVVADAAAADIAGVTRHAV